MLKFLLVCMYMCTKNIHKISAFKNSMKMCAPVGEIVSPLHSGVEQCHEMIVKNKNNKTFAFCAPVY